MSLTLDAGIALAFAFAVAVQDAAQKTVPVVRLEYKNQELDIHRKD